MKKRRSIPISLGGINFKSKSKCQNYLRYILNYSVDIICDNQEFDVLFDLISLHPQSKDKIGCGISHFSIGDSPFHKGQRFFILHRTDGTFEDFSFVKCLGWKTLIILIGNIMRMDAKLIIKKICIKLRIKKPRYSLVEC